MAASSKENYQLLVKQAQSLLENEDDWIANLANLSSLLFYGLKQISFAGFYRYHKGELLLGPFQGRLACVHIPLSKGVCGRAASSKKIQLVADVHDFKGYISCDSRAKSEIVLPVLKNKKLWGVLDIDSDKLHNFEQIDAEYLGKITQLIFN